MIKVIIVDDNYIIIEALQKLVEWEKNNFTIINTFKNGKDALTFIKDNNDIDIIFTDLKMPLMDGLTFIEEFNKLNIYAKIIVLTSYDEYVLIRKAFKLGIKDYILKTELQPKEILAICKSFSNDIIEKKYSNNSMIDNKIINQMLALIEVHLKENINLKILADKLEVSSGYLGQLFTKHTSLSFNEYLNNARIEKAKLMLSSNNYKIYFIASECGYNNVEHFNRMFKKIVGISPSTWQNKK